MGNFDAEPVVSDNVTFRELLNNFAFAGNYRRVRLLSMPAPVESRALYRCPPRLAPRLILVGLGLIVLLYCGARAYTDYITHRAMALLDEAARIQVGATEDSVLPLVARYGGIKGTPWLAEDLNDCPDKAECEYHNAHIPDYSYEVQLSPFNVWSALQQQTGNIHHALAILMFRTSSFLRDPLSLRDWVVFTNIGIRAGRVEAIGSGLYVEGRARWLGNTWELSADMPRLDMQPKDYAISGAFLTFPGNGGASTEHYLTPAATPEQFQAARNINIGCLIGLIPCHCPSDLSPLAFQYLSQHPEAGSTITNSDCPYPDGRP